MNDTWTDYEKKIARHIGNKDCFRQFLRDHLEEYEELAEGKCDVFQLAKEVFEIESIADDYVNVKSFLQNIYNSGLYEFRKPLVDKYGLKISECVIWFEKKLTELKLVIYVVLGVNGTEIIVHTRDKELCKKYL